MTTEPSSVPAELLDRLQQAINDHDLETMADCFAPDFLSEFPNHPDRVFRGRQQMRRNWSQIFAGLPDIQATLLLSAVHGDTAWAEWEWRGSRRDGQPVLLRGVTIQVVRAGRVAHARLYMEPVAAAGPGTEAAVRQVVNGEIRAAR